MFAFTASLLAMSIATSPVAFDDKLAARFANLALACVEREYPNKIAHVMSSDKDAQPPRQLTPVFYGCFDWHSAVHGHWLLVRLLRKAPAATEKAPWRDAARAVLERHFVPARVEKEVAYLRDANRSSFERPYGLAWLLQLQAELHEWDDPQARKWATALEPLTQLAVARLSAWLPKLTHPVRSGEHSQTAFALGLLYDFADAHQAAPWARDFAQLIRDRARAYYLRDLSWPLSYEPSGEDFLSPGLAEADVMRRILPRAAFAHWLAGFLPAESLKTLQPAVVSDRSDGKLVHLDGLNLSRAFMLYGIAQALPTGPLRDQLSSLADAHKAAGIAALAEQTYEGGHWLGSFATYLLTDRGLPPKTP